MHATNIVIVTKNETGLSKQMISLDELKPCHQKEADTRIFVHARHAAAEGIKTFMISANATDVVVIAIRALPSLKKLGLQQLWVAFGQAQNQRWIPPYDLHSSLGPQRTSGILFFHAFSGCDDVSYFVGKARNQPGKLGNF
ncbi:hypothetical protein ACOMHN_064094 [Nucella lapillus]